MKNYYDILGVPVDASKEDIKRAYHILAHQFHPDKEYGNDKRFKDVNEAYRILSHDDSRYQYDRKFDSDQIYKQNKTEEREESVHFSQPADDQLSGVFGISSLIRFRWSREALLLQIKHYQALGWISARKVAAILVMLDIILLLLVSDFLRSPDFIIILLLIMVIPIVLVIFIIRGNKSAMILTILWTLYFPLAMLIAENYGAIPNIGLVLMGFMIIAALSRSIQVEYSRKNIFSEIDEICENGTLSKEYKKDLLIGNIKYMKKISLGWTWLIIVILAAVIFFYWFGVRPEQIRKKCYGAYSGYNNCLIRNGLKSE